MVLHIFVFTGHWHNLFREISIQILCQFLNYLSFLLLYYREVYIYITSISPLWDVVWKYFLPFFGLFFHLLDGIICNTTVFNFDEFLLVFFFISILGIVPEKPLHNPRSWRFTCNFFPKSFIVSSLRYFIHFELIFVDGIKKRPDFCMWLSSCPDTFFWRGCLLSLWMVLVPL